MSRGRALIPILQCIHINELGNIPRGKVEDGMRWSAHPLAEVSSVRERNTTRDDPSLELRLRRDVPSPRDNDFVCRPDLATNELNLVCDEEADGLHVLALPPSP